MQAAGVTRLHAGTHLGAFKIDGGGSVSAALGRVGHTPLRVFPHDHTP